MFFGLLLTSINANVPYFLLAAKNSKKAKTAWEHQDTKVLFTSIKVFHENDLFQ